jgi:CDP-diacylglycerol--serine O-phosphatidyltransferase
MKYGHWLANGCTALNLLAGVVSLELASQGKFVLAALAVVAGMVFDALDGKIARLFSATGSNFGKELDSLCDVVTFGVAPAFLLFKVMQHRYPVLAALVAGCFAVCGAMRLARFNTNPAIPGKGFTGMPITGAGGMLAVVALRPRLLTPLGLLLFALLLSFLMVSTLKYPDFKAVHLPKSLGSRLILLGLLLALAALWARFGSLELAIIPLLVYTASGPFYTYKIRKAESQR